MDADATAGLSMSEVAESTLCRRRDDCRLCGGGRLDAVVELTPTPPANAFVPASALAEPQPVFPLTLYFCEDCHHLQLRDVVDPRHLFEHYVYVSGTSPVFVRHFEDYAARVIETLALQPGSLVVDIGSNDGTLLKAFAAHDMRVLGVDPALDIAARASAEGIPTIAEFFTPALAERIAAEHGHAALVTANNVFAHADDLAGIWGGVRRLVGESGVFVFEVSYLLDVVLKTLFDTVYHEHLAYHSVAPLRRFFAAAAGVLFRAERVSSHGGSLRGFARPAGAGGEDGSVTALVALEREAGLHRAATFRDWSRRIDTLGSELRALLARLRSEGASVAGFGAPAKATTLMYHFGIDRDAVAFIVDDSPLKQGLYTPGLHVPVLSSAALEEHRPDYLLVLAWNFADAIIERQQSHVERGGRFIVPLPELKVVPG